MQREASLCYGNIVDLSFPAVAPNNDNAQLQALAKEWVQKIVAMGELCDITVHIMGEMTFTFMVVTRLKGMGIKCIASTTERKTTYNDEGTKLSEFSFVKFREY
jgi:hypothetical protein